MDRDELAKQLAKHENSQVRVRILGLHAPIIGVTRFGPADEIVIHLDPEWLPGAETLFRNPFQSPDPGEP